MPPHGVLLDRVENGEAEYRPPVPPHRNIGVTTRLSRQSPHGEPGPEQLRTSPVPNLNENLLPRVGKPVEGKYNRGSKVADNNGPRRHHHHHHHHHRNSGSKGGRHSRNNEPDLTRPLHLGGMDEGEDLPEAFVEFNTTPPEVKRATIVGNPMFSNEERGDEQRAREDLLALEDLNLGMDYQQIMEYFDNLKESNA